MGINLKRIKNVVLDTSELDNKELLNSIRLEKGKLLSKSEWTQLLDSGLTLSVQQQWANWRDRVRSVEITEASLDEAKSTLEDLKANTPSTVVSRNSNIIQTAIDDTLQFNMSNIIIPTIKRFVNSSMGNINHYSCIEDLRAAAKIACVTRHTFRLNANISRFGHPELFRERYEEALMCDELTATPLLDIVVADTGLTKIDVIAKIIADRTEYYKILLEFEKQVKVEHLLIDSLSEQELLDKLIEYGYRYRPSSIGPGDSENIPE